MCFHDAYTLLSGRNRHLHITGQNKLSHMSVFSIGIMLNFQSLVDFQKCLKQMKIITKLKLDNSILHVGVFRYVRNFPRVPIFSDFTKGMIGNETGHLLGMCEAPKKRHQYRQTYHVLRRNGAATSLKISFTNHYSVKSYDETNIKVFALSLWEKN